MVMVARTQQPILHRDSIVAIAGPASPCSSQSIMDHIVTVVSEEYGFECLYDRDTYEVLTAEERAEIFLNYLLDDQVEMIWACRGGEGSADIIPLLESHKSAIRKAKPKWLVGFSDITALLFYFYQTYHWPVMHGPNAHGFVNLVNAASKTHMMNYLLGQRDPVVLSDVKCLSLITNDAPVCIEAPLVAANLTLLTLCVQDLWHANLDGKILVIEEVNEKPYAVSRSLKYLSRTGLLSGVQALLFGDFSMGGDADPYAFIPVFKQFAQQQTFPVFFAPYFGHRQENRPLVFGQQGLFQYSHNDRHWQLSC